MLPTNRPQQTDLATATVQKRSSIGFQKLKKGLTNNQLSNASFLGTIMLAPALGGYAYLPLIALGVGSSLVSTYQIIRGLDDLKQLEGKSGLLIDRANQLVEDIQNKKVKSITQRDAIALCCLEDGVVDLLPPWVQNVVWHTQLRLVAGFQLEKGVSPKDLDLPDFAKLPFAEINKNQNHSAQDCRAAAHKAWQSYDGEMLRPYFSQQSTHITLSKSTKLISNIMAYLYPVATLTVGIEAVKFALTGAAVTNPGFMLGAALCAVPGFMRTMRQNETKNQDYPLPQGADQKLVSDITEPLEKLLAKPPSFALTKPQRKFSLSKLLPMAKSKKQPKKNKLPKRDL